jgi:hypothetical protein
MKQEMEEIDQVINNLREEKKMLTELNEDPQDGLE